MDTIYDVGMNNGEDSAYYLHCGFRVIAIEANPLLVETATRRFISEVMAGRLTIVNCAVAKVTGETDFWISEKTEWGSIVPSLAARDYRKICKIRVPAMRFEQLLDSYGTPRYLKIDIEGMDYLCIDALKGRRLPQYISAESECLGIDEVCNIAETPSILEKLVSVGYTKFKLVSQHDLTPLSREAVDRSVDAEYRALVKREIEKECGWEFLPGSSGPFGSSIPGPWMHPEEAAWVYGRCRELLRDRFGEAGSGIWFDWHATTSEHEAQWA